MRSSWRAAASSCSLCSNNLAYAYQSAGQLDRAIPLYQRALADIERILGPGHPNTLMTRNNLAGAYESAGDLGQAVPLYERTLRDCERHLSPGHPIADTVRSNLEHARRVQGRQAPPDLVQRQVQ